MKTIFQKITIKSACVLTTLSLFISGCSGGGTAAIDKLFGSTQAPILTSIQDQTVAQTDLLAIDVNNIREGNPGNDKDMLYACVYDQVVDGLVASGTPCSSLPGTATFNVATGILNWTPNTATLGNFEFKITGVYRAEKYDELFTVGVRLKFNGVGLYTNITGTSVTANWAPNTAATAYQIFKLNSLTGQYEIFRTINGGSSSGAVISGLTPNTGYTLRVQALDTLGNLDGNVVSRSFTTTELVKFSMTPATATVAAGTPLPITVQAYNANNSPQTVGGLPITPQIASGTSSGTFSTVVDNNNGTYSFNFTPSVVGTPISIDITTNTTFFLNNTTDLTIVTGPPSSTNSSISISSNTVISSQAVTVTATVRDAYNNPIESGSTISFNKTGGTSTGVFSAVTNQGNGVYSATYTGITAGTAQTLTVSVNGTPLTPATSVSVVPGTPVSAQSNLTISSSTISSGAVATITATLKDINANPVSSGILVSFNKSGGTSSGSFDTVTNAGSGNYTTTYTGLTSGTAQTISVSVDGVTLNPTVTVTVVPGAPALANSSLTISANTVVSGNFVTVTATLKDINSNPIESGVTVSFSKAGGTSTGTFGTVSNQGAGVYNIRYTGVVAGTNQTLKVLVNGVDLGPSVTVNVTPGAPSAAQSTIAVASSSVISGNSVVVTATIKDANNNAIPSGILVSFSKTGGTSTGNYSSVTNQGAGVYQISYEGVLAGSAQTLGVSVDGSALGPTTTVSVVPGAPSVSTSTFATSASTITSGSAATLTAHIKDAQGNDISSGITVSFDKSGGTSTGTFSTITNQGNGIYTVTYSGLVSGTAQTLRLQIGGSNFGSSLSITVNPGAASPTQSSISLSSTTVLSGSTVLVTATIKDANNNPISSGILVAFSKTGGTSTGNYSSVTNQGAGVYQVNYEGVVSGSAQTLGVSIDGIALGPTIGLTVLPGAPSNALSTLTLTSNTVVSGTSVTLTARIKDANSNDISSGILMSFDKIGGTSTGTLSSTTNQGSGIYTATYTGVTAGTAQTIQANVNGAGFGPTQNLQVLVGAPVASKSTLTVTSSPLASGNTATIAALIRDINNNPITNQYVITFDTAGGSSTGNLGTTNNTGNGNFNASYEGVLAGSAQTVKVLADGNPISGLTSTIQVIAGAVNAGNSTFNTSAGTVQSGTTANFTINLRDVNNNAITNATVTFNKTAGVSNGNITGATHTSNGNYPSVYTATTQGTAQTVTLVVNGSAVPAMNVSITVTAGPPASLAVTGPANPLNSIDCNGPYTATLKDASNNTTSSLSGITLSLLSTSSVHAGKIFTDSSCTNSVSSLSMGVLVSSVQYYYKSYIPQSFTLTLRPSDGSISDGTFALQNSAVISFIGSAANVTFNGSGATTIFDDRGGGFWGSYDSTIVGNFLYSVDASGNRITKHNIATNTFVGWVGHIGSIEGISAPCTSSALGDLTPGWCTGGRSNPGVTTLLNAPRGIAADATYIYVGSNHRILRFRQDDGTYAGWIGRVNSTAPPVSGQLATCTGQTTSVMTPGWCVGGNWTSGSGDGQMNTPTDVSVFGGKLYVADYNNNRILRYNVTTGAFEGWSGRVGTVPTSPGACSGLTVGDTTTTWCYGGTAQASNRYNLQVSPSETTAPPEGLQNPIGLDVDASYIYVADYSNRRIVRITPAGVYSGWLGRIYRGNSAANTTTPTAGNNIYTPAWTFNGTTQEVGSTSGFCATTSVKIYSGYLYITDNCHKVIRVQANDGQDYRWIGRVSTSPTGGVTGCSSTPVSGVTPGWCLGGAGNRIGNTNSAFYNPYSIDIKDNTMYVTDLSNFRVQKLALDTGEFQGWIGAANNLAAKWTRIPAAQYSRGGIDDYSFANMDGNWAGVAISGSSLFVPDPGMHRIKRHNLLDGSIVGYIGQINIFPPTGPDTCVGYTSGMTPDWCTGGGRTQTGSGIHGYNAPYGVATDGANVYVANNGNDRVDKIRVSDALYLGWIGRVSATPTDGDPACLTRNTGDLTPGWCIGGTAQASNAEGGYNSLRNLYYDSLSSKLFIVDTGKLTKVDPSTGAVEGILGHITSGSGGCSVSGNVSNGFCTTGTGSTGINSYGGLNDGTGIAVSSSYIYVSDTGAHRIHRFNKSDGTPAGFLGRMQNSTNVNTNAVTGGGCASLTTGYPQATPGWCFGTAPGSTYTAVVADSAEGAYNSPRGIWTDGTYLYITDSNNHRIVRIKADTGAYEGWKGHIVSTTGMNGICLASGAGSITPTWCKGGTSGPSTKLGGFDLPTGITGDANYLYIHDGRNNRIVTIPIN